jgi:hypothetical protein
MTWVEKLPSLKGPEPIGLATVAVAGPVIEDHWLCGTMGSVPRMELRFVY